MMMMRIMMRIMMIIMMVMVVKNFNKFLGIDNEKVMSKKPPGTGEEEEGVLLDCESVSISSSSTSTGKRASNAAKLLGR